MRTKKRICPRRPRLVSPLWKMASGRILSEADAESNCHHVWEQFRFVLCTRNTFSLHILKESCLVGGCDWSSGRFCASCRWACRFFQGLRWVWKGKRSITALRRVRSVSSSSTEAICWRIKTWPGGRPKILHVNSVPHHVTRLFNLSLTSAEG